MGYAKVPNAREVRNRCYCDRLDELIIVCYQVLCSLYSKTLTALSQLPKEAAYRRYTEQIVQQRLQIVQAVSMSIPRVYVHGSLAAQSVCDGTPPAAAGGISKAYHSYDDTSYKILSKLHLFVCVLRRPVFLV